MVLETDQLIWVVKPDGQGLRETTPPSHTAPPGAVRRVLPFESPAGVVAPGLSYSHVRVSESEDTVEDLPRTPGGGVDWKALDGDLATVKKGVGGLLTVEVTKNGRTRVFAGIVASPVTININPTP